MWKNSHDSYRSGGKHHGENMQNAITGQRERNMDPRMNRKTPQQYGNTNNYTSTRTSQLSTKDSRNVSQNNPVQQHSGMVFPNTNTLPPPPAFSMPPSGQSSTRMPFNVPPPGFNNMNVPPPGFNNTIIPPPGFNNTNLPPPGFNRNILAAGFIDQRMPPPDFVNNIVRPGSGQSSFNNRLSGSMPSVDGQHPVGILPPDRGPMGINNTHSNVTMPPSAPMVNNPGPMGVLQTFPVNQMHVGNQPGGQIQNSASVIANQQTEARMADQTWVDTFIKERNLTPKSETKLPQVGEAKQMLEKWFQLINEMEAQHSKLSERITAGDSEWQREMQKTSILREEVLQMESEFSSQYDMDSLLKGINKKRKKREWKKRQKRNLAIKKKDIETKSFEMHIQIDQWRDKEIAKDQAKFKAASMKKEAGGVLGDVRRKQSDSSKALGLLEALKKLRSFRKQEAELKGVYPKPSPDQNREFDKRLEVLEKIMKKHHELYESEEKTLVVMMAEEEEEKEKERRKKRHTKQLAQAAASDSSDPMREFYRYYTQAENGLDSLLHIRHGWDVYIVPQTLPGASLIPQGTLTPVTPSSKPWAVFLQDKG